MEISDCFRVKINSIHPSQPIVFDLYIMVNQRLLLYLRTGDFLTEEKIAKLEKKDGEFYVQESQREAYKKYVSDQINSESISAQDKAQILRESSYTLVAELFENPDVHKALDDAKEVVSDFVDFMDANPEGMAHLISLSGHDFYTYNHSLDVGIYSLGLAKVLGFSKEETEELGQGALFHDIGKRNVSPEIICKDGPLDDIEWAQMQKHPVFGLKILNEHDGVSEAIKAACFEHHENFLGTGYPQQLLGHEIHPHARIIALTDTFDAMTTQRSYNVPKTPAEAIQFMNEKLSDRYDPDMLKAFSSVLFNE